VNFQDTLNKEIQMRHRILAVIVSIFAVVMVSQAQDAIEFPDGSSIELGRDWEIQDENSNPDAGTFVLINEDEEVLVVFYFYASDLLDDNRIDSLEEFVEYDYGLYTAAEEQPFDDRNMEEAEVQGLPAFEYTFEGEQDGDTYDVTIIYFITDDNVGYTAEVTPLSGSRPSLAPVYDLLETLQFGGGGGGGSNNNNNNNNSDLSEEFELADGSTISYPEDWSAEINNDDVAIIDGGEEFILISVDGRPDSEAPDEYLQAYYEATFGDTVRSRDIETLEVAGLEAASFDFTQDLDAGEYDVRLITAVTNDGDMVVALLGVLADSDADFDLPLEVLNTFEPR
jgi:hypothetical protein